MRSVQLDVPPGSVPLLRTLKGFENFNPSLETLDMIKPGYGLKDAPRLWNLALKRCLSEAGLKPLQADEQLFVKHAHGALVLIVSTHVDDLKAGGIESELKHLITLLESRFDELKIQLDEFEHLGLVHKRVGDYVEVHQNQYIAQLRCISSALTLADDEADLDASSTALFMSLLGGVGWVVQTRPDVAAYVGALQRHLKNPKVKHLKRLNRVVRYVKAHPLVLKFKRVPPPTCLGIISDSAFQAKDQDCLAVKSGIVCLMQKSVSTVDGSVSPIEWVSKKQTHVCRSTYAAELHSALDLIGIACIINSAFTETLNGTCSSRELATLQDKGGYALTMNLFIDAMSVFSSVTASTIKTPCDKMLLHHARAVREFLDAGVLDWLFWIDTRDMVCDALNKGTVNRDAIRHFFQTGLWKLVHEPKKWTSANRSKASA